MRVICAIGQRGGPDLIQRLVEMMGNQAECLLLHVIHRGPRHDLENFLRGPLLHGPHRDKAPHDVAVTAAEEAAGQAAIEEALTAARQLGLNATASIKEGKPEKIIVEVAKEMRAALIVIWAREGAVGHPPIGPASVGHAARFVLDHAPCDVLMLREKGI